MNPRRGFALRTKVVLVIVSTAGTALALAAGLLLAHDRSETRERMGEQLSALADVTAEGCQAALRFGDRGVAQEKLDALAADPAVVAAVLFAADGEVFARFARASSDGLPDAPGLGVETSPDHLGIFRPVRDGRARLGTLYLRSDLSPVERRESGYRSVIAATFVASMAVALLLAWALQRVVSRPIADLARVARHVARRRDFSVRVPAAYDDEVGELVDTFNDMLAQIEERDDALRRTLGRLEESEERYELAVTGASDGIWDWNLRTDTVYYSARWRSMFGYDDEELVAGPSEWFDRIHPDDVARVRARLEEHLAGKRPDFECEFWMAHRLGGLRWVLARGLAVRDGAGAAHRIAGSITDVTERRGRDPLTGLPNRLLFIDRLGREIERSSRADSPSFAVLCVELERLTLVNETLGRPVGRDLLLEAARRISDVLRPEDTLARMELGAFAILLTGIADVAYPARLAAKIHASIAHGFLLRDQEVLTSAAIGISLGATGYDGPEPALRDAATAMQRAQALGWNRTEVFDESMRERAFARLELESGLLRALERNELELHYQPIVTLPDRRLAGFEALVRWRRAGELVPPGEFIGVAEDSGIIAPLGRWVLDRACRDLRDWLDRALVRPESLLVSVNVSAKQLAAGDFRSAVAVALEGSGLPPSALKLEVTESGFLGAIEPCDASLRGLRDLGVGTWIDDFGTGYSSLSYLHRLPIEAIKIDRSFVAALDDGNGAGALVRTIVDLGRNLGLRTIAEGVEAEGQVDRLADLGCDFAQGFLVSRPLGVSDAGNLVASG
jgi:diguanylate cyclase (GGDEF)-like protein/PAS domain S-box-containing protein